MAVYRRFIVIESSSGGDSEVGRYEDPAVAWRDIEALVAKHQDPPDASPENALPEYTVFEIRTSDSKLITLQKAREG